jgi:hypothetical protein
MTGLGLPHHLTTGPESQRSWAAGERRASNPSPTSVLTKDLRNFLTCLALRALAWLALTRHHQSIDQLRRGAVLNEDLLFTYQRACEIAKIFEATERRPDKS